MKSPVTRGAVFVASCLALSGCQAGYVLRQAWGQLTYRSSEIPIDSPRLAEVVGPEASARLAWVPRLLDFARREIGLDPGDSYTTYVDTGGRPVSFVVTACHPLALIPFQWSFPFAGRVPYKGHFAEEHALEEARELKARGYEALVHPVGAFSTLGWFRDPVVSSMLEGSIADLADVIFHETTHRTFYVPGETSFNESLATFVAREATERFLRAHPELSDQIEGYRRERESALERETLLLRLRNDLDALYRSGLDESAKVARKAEIFATGAEALARLEGSPPRLRASNAAVLSFARYHEHTALLERVQRRLGGEPRRLVEELKKLPSGADPVAALLRIEGGAGP